MLLRELAGKTVCILGFGKEGKAALAAIRHHAPTASITLADRNADIATSAEAAGLPTQLGDAWLTDLARFDILIKSPGIPPQPALDAVRANTTTATRLFFSEVRERGAIIVGVTGTKGKSTTSSLLAAMLRDAGKDALLLGNIGTPSLSKMESIKKNTIIVHELSSYQLQDLDVSPRIAVVTSFFPEHLDYHGSIESYLDAKCHITRFQGPDDAVFFCAASAGAVRIAQEGEGRKIPFGADDAPVAITETYLLGAHNLSNIGGAFLVAQALGVPATSAIATIRAFQGLPHRLQMVGRYGGIDWVDDAISTTPESAIAALEALGDRVDTVILGGQDRGLEFTALGNHLTARTAVRTAILFPGTGPRIREAIAAAGRRDITMIDAATMEDAVRIAAEHTNSGAICLLSTASPSYNMFKNFEEKGDVFQRCVRALGA